MKKPWTNLACVNKICTTEPDFESFAEKTNFPGPVNRTSFKLKVHVTVHPCTIMRRRLNPCSSVRITVTVEEYNYDCNSLSLPLLDHRGVQCSSFKCISTHAENSLSEKIKEGTLGLSLRSSRLARITFC